MAETQFIDVSSHQGSIDPVAIRKAGVVGVFWKATEGLTFVDPSFGKASDPTAVRIKRLHERHVALENAGLVSVPYHFCRADNHPTTAGAREEARWFSSVLDKAGYPHGKPVCLDYEVKPVTRDWAEAFADELQKLRGRGMITYVGRFLWNQQKAPKGGAMLWLPAYVPRLAYAVYAAYMRARGFVVKAWQYTSSGRVPGVSGNVDRNVWFGSEAEFRAWAKAPAAPKPPPPVPQPKGDKAVRVAQQQLRKIGWPLVSDGVKGPQTTEAIKDFQRGWAGSMKMRQHGKLGIHTKRALKWSSEHGGLTSKGGHFKYGEWKSKGNGWIKVERSLIRGLEKYRKLVGPTGIVSGYRDKAHNAKVGGATNSQHVYGNAADLNPKLSTAEVKSMGVFSGIGYQGNTGLVRHVDVRHVGPNTTGGTTKNPTVWRY